MSYRYVNIGFNIKIRQLNHSLICKNFLEKKVYMN